MHVSIARLSIAAVALLATASLAQVGVLAASGTGNGDTTEVHIFMNDGSDVTGHLSGVSDTTLNVKTDKGPVTVSRKKYQGMVLNNAQQNKMASLITTNPVVMADYGLETQKSRKKLDLELHKSMKPTCAADGNGNIPVVEVQINRAGNIGKTVLLNGSNCPALNQALQKEIRLVKMEPLPKDYPFDMHTFNYFYTPGKSDELNQKPVAAKSK